MRTTATAPDHYYFSSDDPPMGLRCARATLPAAGNHVEHHQVSALLVPCDATIATVTLASGSLTLDKSSLLYLPPGTGYQVASASALPHLITFLFHDSLRAAAVVDYGGEIDRARFDELVLNGPALLPRTLWINELCHRYVFELTHCKKRASRAARFIELELTKELYFLLGEHSARLCRATIMDGATALTERATAFLEQHLFVALDLTALAEHCGASESTILRSLKRDLGQSPSAYVRLRRLDEALLLLKAGRSTVEDIARRVGYRSPASFAHAFRRRFGTAPSQVRAFKGRS